ncbi:MAG: DinB family protein [Gemmatimonadota bacterium]|nr:MAG: DinB family protein [Gemmatimonadota bacterium]
MTGRRSWIDRRFELGLPAEAFPDILERVRGTPARLEERVRVLTPDEFNEIVDETWSIQENIGHLLDLEELWAGRIDDLLSGAEELRPADLENTKTHQAGHNERDPEDLLQDFREARMAMIARLEELTDDEIQRTATHPRLQQPMSVVDLFYFVAEHDDHHLARISEIMRTVV